MNRPRAARLSRSPQMSKGWFSRWLPPGSIQRRLFFGLAVPLVCLMLAALIMDKIVMPIVTRQGSAFPLPDFTSQRLLEARISLSELDLKYEVSSEEFSPGLPAGVILQQFPQHESETWSHHKVCHFAGSEDGADSGAGRQVGAAGDARP